MKIKPLLTRVVVVITISLPFAQSGRAADELEQRLGQYFYTPEMLTKAKDLLNPTDDQITKIKEAIEDAQQKTGELAAKLRERADKFAEIVKGRQIDAAAAREAGDRLLEADHELKRAQLELLVFIKNNLTPEQQTTLNMVRSLEPKIKEAQRLAEAWKAKGRSLDPFEGMKSEFESALRAGKLSDAESVIDRALARLREK